MGGSRSETYRRSTTRSQGFRVGPRPVRFANFRAAVYFNSPQILIWDEADARLRVEETRWSRNSSTS